MSKRIISGLNNSLERWLPEKRLFLRSDDATRFIRLKPLTQFACLAGGAVMFGWTLFASSVIAIDAISSGSSEEQMVQARESFEDRLTQLSAERDARAAEALAAQNRFTSALQEVSHMQSQLLASEKKRSELETGLQTVQSTLRDAISKRNVAEEQVRTADGGAVKDPAREEEISVALDILSGELRDTAKARGEAVQTAEEAQKTAEELRVERDEIIARNDEILNELENAVTVSVKPLDDVFRSVGMDPDTVLKSIRKGYSGAGGPLNPISYSTSGNAALKQGETKARQIVVTLDEMNTYRIAIEKLPLAMPVKSSYRLTSSFGRRWGRMHEGIDMAGPTGTAIYATGDGIVTFAGRQSGYGNIIKISHELGTETRIA